MKPQPSDLIGKSVRSVMIELEELHLDFRLIKIDGHVISQDFHSNPVRYNIEVENMIVVRVWLG